MRAVRLFPAFPGQSAAAALAVLGLRQPLPCGGQGRCGNCVVWLRGALALPDEAERTVLKARVQGNAPLPGYVPRLACRCRLQGYAECLFAEEDAQVHAAAPSAGDFTLPPYVGDAPNSLGFAVDIGTTTITLELFRFPETKPIVSISEMNRQSAFGADVLSRIAHAAAHGKESGVSCIQEQLAAMLFSALARANASPDEITRGCATGNTTMLHFLANLSPVSMGQTPFTPCTLFGEEHAANEILPVLPPTARLYLPPSVSAFVGADITCGALACNLCATENTLLADVGTNGEMMLHTKAGALFCCATAAGPAFEGAEITMGMPALPGAVDRVWGEGGRLCWHMVGALTENKAKGICGTGLISALRFFLEDGTLGETGGIEAQEDNPYLLWREDGPALWLGESGVVITQRDIRKLQLVKASIAAGIDTLLAERGLSPADLGRLWLGGGFGSFLAPDDAAAIGMLPAAAAARAQPAGNIALRGAEMLLFNSDCREQARKIAQNATEIPLATHPVFQDAFVERMGFR
ncbi:MAG: ASKHA domain-containing protein [Oscillospiraceae bacterium]|jgi:uncharacterized 2Fe-2S/4Fe-4S cluster protein (DUF4445 family)|nr:ASKHA domain-containing protein [Oscillospiraceae bacterium]